MPINIYNTSNSESIAWLCDGNWRLPDQIDILEEWLVKEGQFLTKGSYVADIGFDIRKDASGGGAVLNSKAMKVLGEIGMDIYLSEYPGQNSEEE